MESHRRAAPSGMTPTLLDYYDRRLPEYDAIYRRAERQADLEQLRALVRAGLAGTRVLELACGTGYWTAVAAETAAAVVATDVSQRALDVARTRVTARHVRFELANAMAPLVSDRDFTAGLAAFWWSHIPRASITGFLKSLLDRLGPGRRVVLLDNRYVAGSSTPISRTDLDGNTYQRRRLPDGSEVEIVKNFPKPRALAADLGHVADPVTIHEFEYYWYAECILRPLTHKSHDGHPWSSGGR